MRRARRSSLLALAAADRPVGTAAARAPRVAGTSRAASRTAEGPRQAASGRPIAGADRCGLRHRIRRCRTNRRRRAQEAATRRQVEESERVRAMQVDAQRHATEQAAQAMAEEKRLTAEQSAALDRLKRAEAAVNEMTRHMQDLNQRRAEAQSRIDKRVAALRPMLPVIVRMSDYPVETLLGAQRSAEDAVRGILVMRDHRPSGRDRRAVADRGPGGAGRRDQGGGGGRRRNWPPPRPHAPRRRMPWPSNSPTPRSAGRRRSRMRRMPRGARRRRRRGRTRCARCCRSWKRSAAWKRRGRARMSCAREREQKESRGRGRPGAAGGAEPADRRRHARRRTRSRRVRSCRRWPGRWCAAGAIRDDGEPATGQSWQTGPGRTRGRAVRRHRGLRRAIPRLWFAGHHRLRRRLSRRSRGSGPDAVARAGLCGGDPVGAMQAAGTAGPSAAPLRQRHVRLGCFGDAMLTAGPTRQPLPWRESRCDRAGWHQVAAIADPVFRTAQGGRPVNPTPG